MIAIVERLVDEKITKIKALAETEEMNAEAKLYAILWRQSYDDESIIEFLHHEYNASIHQKVLVQIVQESAEFILVGVNIMFDTGIFLWQENSLDQKKLAFNRIVERMLGNSFTFSNPNSIIQ
ncbi:hypothetical protein A8L34_23115 [Bacillus sp. FJAT-27264]|nr:hypothetical protein A8L34_23115 [Bacillus sp. FJAT-27264]